MGPLEVRAVHTARDLSDFIAVARIAQADNPRWVSLPDLELRIALDPKRSPFGDLYELCCFVARRGDGLVGRIVAIRDKTHLQKHDDRAGHFGLIEAIDDVEVFAALLDEAAAWFRERGLTSMRGPYNLSINHDVGLLIEGFDEPHTVRTNHAPPHYARHFAALGFAKAMDLEAHVITLPQAAEERARPVPAGAADIRIRSLSRLRWRSGVRELVALYNDAWSGNWGSTPIGQAEAWVIGALMLPIARASWLTIADYGTEPVALLAQLPDVNEHLAPLAGSLAGFNIPRLLWNVHRRGPRRTRIAMMGVSQARRATPVGSTAIRLLFADAIRKAQDAGVEEIEISWILETNTAALKLVAGLGARRSKVFRLYQRDV